MRYDLEEDRTYQERTGDELPEDLKLNQGRLAQIKAAKKAFGEPEAQINPGKDIKKFQKSNSHSPIG